MNLKWLLAFVIVIAIVVAVEGSMLLRDSLMRPRNFKECFSCSASDRPFTYPLISYFGKIKDVFVRMFKKVMESAKDYKLDYK